jgi:hypothetical protein
MPPLAGVGDLQVLEDVAGRIGVRGPVRPVREFDLERREEARGDSVIRAVASAAHAHDDAVGLDTAR